jgi:hypothetical protein
MIYFLRNNKNETILDVELFIKETYIELKSIVCIEPYSKLLLEIFKVNPVRSEKFIKIFDEMQELQGWLWRKYFRGLNNDIKEFDNVQKELEKILKNVCKEFPELNIVND